MWSWSRPGGGSLRWAFAAGVTGGRDRCEVRTAGVIGGRDRSEGSGPGAVSAGPDARPKGRTRRGREPAPRRVYQQVTLTEAEREQLRARAAQLGVSVPRLLVESALSEVETPTDRRRTIAELFEVRRLLATVANNVNQLARSAHISGQLDAGRRLDATLGEVDVLLARMRELTGARR
jgi:hypothetical protein